MTTQQYDSWVTVRHAQSSAIQAKSGDALINTQVQEKGLWACVLNSYTTTVSGEVIKLKAVR